MPAQKLTKPVVSIVMPVYNAGDFLNEAVKSIIKQTYVDWELIAIDDGSSDGSRDKLNEWKESDDRIKVIVNEKNLGVAASLNKGILQARGKYIARMDADDMSMPERIEKQVDFMEANDGVVVVGTFMEEINSQGELINKRRLPTGDKEIKEMMWYAMGLQHPTIMINREKIPDDFEWYKQVKYAEDLEMLFRMAEYGNYANLPEYLFLYRVHEHNETLSTIKPTMRSASRVRREAMKKSSFLPSWKARVIFCGSQVMLWLPDKLIMKLYGWLRR